MPTQRKAPFRPRTAAEISQAFNDGVVILYDVEDATARSAETAGLFPEEERTEKLRLPYQERKLGIKRYYEAMQNQIHAERVIRVPLPPTAITSQDLAETEDGRLYRIDLVQVMTDSFPPCADLTLTAYAQRDSADPEAEGGAEP